jgi:transcription elongation factor Elf1
MKKNVVVWRESVYKNKFKCNQCGHQVGDAETGAIKDDTLVDEKNECPYIFCSKCKNAVAYFKEMEIPENASGLMGNIDDLEVRKNGSK